jgi:hypothetical protein
VPRCLHPSTNNRQEALTTIVFPTASRSTPILIRSAQILRLKAVSWEVAPAGACLVVSGSADRGVQLLHTKRSSLTHSFKQTRMWWKLALAGIARPTRIGEFPVELLLAFAKLFLEALFEFAENAVPVLASRPIAKLFECQALRVPCDCASQHTLGRLGEWTEPYHLSTSPCALINRFSWPFWLLLGRRTPHHDREIVGLRAVPG